MIGSLMRLAVGIASSALRKYVSPVPRCFMATAALPLWAAAIVSSWVPRPGDGSAADADVVAIRTRVARVALPGWVRRPGAGSAADANVVAIRTRVASIDLPGFALLPSN